MTTYRAIANSEVAENAPLTALLVAALRDNVLAISEGDGTAPDISAAALDYIPVGTSDTWQDLSGSRVIGTSYQNTTGQAIEVSVRIDRSGGGAFVFEASTDNSTWITVGDTGGAVTGNASVSVTIADDEYYRAFASGGASGTISMWAERRPV